MATAICAGGLMVGLSTLLILESDRWPYSDAYFLLCLLLEVAGCAAIGSIGSVGRLHTAVLPLWVAATHALSLQWWHWQLGGPLQSSLRIVLPTLAVAVALLLTGSRIGAASRAVSVAGGVFLHGLVLPPLTRSLAPLREADWLLGQLASAFVLLLLCSALLTLCSLAQRRSRRLGDRWAPLAIVLALGLIALTVARPADPPGIPISTRAERSSLPSILLVVLDTTRADHLSLYGYERDTSPRLFEWVSSHPDSLVFGRAFSNSNWTVPSHASLLTGLMPSDHGAHFDPEHGSSAPQTFALRSSTPTLAELLREQHYRTALITANPYLLWTRGLRRGFDLAHQPPPPQALTVLGEQLRRLLLPGVFPESLNRHPIAQSVSREVLRQLEGCNDGLPCFIVANYLEPHALYIPAPPQRGIFHPWSWREPIVQPRLATGAERLERLEARYDEEIVSLDDEIGHLLERLDESGALAHTWVIVTSDHGEAFGEHGVTEHSTSIYNEEVRIPLIVLPPSAIEVETDHPVSLIDVAHTIARLGGVEISGSGRDLLASSDVPATVQIEFFGDPGKAAFFGDLAAEPARAIVFGDYKLIEHAGRFELYDLGTDPEERIDLSSSRRGLVDQLSRLLPPLRAAPALHEQPPREPPSLPRDQLDLLRSLGYVP